jgi:hypothetical protein
MIGRSFCSSAIFISSSIKRTLECGDSSPLCGATKPSSRPQARRAIPVREGGYAGSEGGDESPHSKGSLACSAAPTSGFVWCGVVVAARTLHENLDPFALVPFLLFAAQRRAIFLEKRGFAHGR